MADEPLNIAQAQAVIAGRSSLLPAETRPIDEALGLVLAEQVIASGDVPSCANSAMDGFAVRGADLNAMASTTGLPIATGIDRDLQAAGCDRIAIIAAAVPQDQVVIAERAQIIMVPHGEIAGEIRAEHRLGRHRRLWDASAGEDVMRCFRRHRC